MNPPIPGPDAQRPGGPPAASSHRLHALTLPLRLIGHAKKLILPGLIVLFLAREGSWEIYLMLMFVPSTIFEVLRYISMRYRFAHDELIVNSGILFRNERHIPFARIQNLDLVQSPLERIFKVAKVRIETASGTEAEATLDLLSLEAVERMRQNVFAGRAETAGAIEAPEEGETASDVVAPSATSAARVVLRVPTLDLARLGLIFNRGWALVAIAAGLAWEFDLWEKIPARDWLETNLEELDTLMAALFAVGVALGGMILLWCFSMIWTMMRFHGYTLERIGDDLRVTCGLLTRFAATVPRHRIQLVSVHESLGHRLMGRVTVRIETAGGREKEGQQTLSRKWFVPIMRRSDLPGLLHELDDGLILDDIEWKGLAPKATRRLVTKSLIITGLVCVPIILFLEWWGLLALILLPLAWWHAVMWVRLAGFSRTAARVCFRSGVLTRKTSAALCRKIQVVSLGANPFDRRWKMAKLAVDTAGAGPADHRIRIPFMARADAEQLMASLTREVEHSELTW